MDWNTQDKNDDTIQSPDKRPSPSQFPEINLKGIAVVIFSILLIWIVWTVIQGLSDIGSEFGSAVMYWQRRASINPDNKQGFTFFLKLLLVAGFIGTVLWILRKK